MSIQFKSKGENLQGIKCEARIKENVACFKKIILIISCIT